MDIRICVDVVIIGCVGGWMWHVVNCVDMGQEKLLHVHKCTSLSV